MRGNRCAHDPRVRESGTVTTTRNARKWRRSRRHNPLVRGSVDDGTTRNARKCKRRRDPLVRGSAAETVQSAGARKTGKPHCSEEQGLRRLVRKRCGYRLDWGHRPIQEYAQHVRAGVTLSTTGPQASGITLDRAGALSWNLLVMRTASDRKASASAVRWDLPGMDPLWSIRWIP